MPPEVLTYQIHREVQSGPFGIRRRQEPVGQLSEGDLSRLPIGRDLVEVRLESGSQTLTIKAGDRPIAVEFGAEPQMLKPRVSTRLDHSQSVITGRRKVTIYPEYDSSQKLVLEAPRREPLRLTAFQEEYLYN